MSRYQKGETNLDFTEARDSEWQWHQLNHMQVCTLLQTDNHASTPPLRFLQARCPSYRPTNSVRALKAWVFYKKDTLKDFVNWLRNPSCFWRHWLKEWLHAKFWKIASAKFCTVPNGEPATMENYTVSQKKTRHQTLGHNFTNYYPIFKFFSLANSVVNL